MITKRSEDGTFMEAELEVGFQVLVERYISQVTLHPPHKVQSTVHDSMLFHHLDSTWSMEAGPSPNTCWLSFNVDFAFNNALYGNLAEMFFSEVVQRMIGAFEKRCQTMYGPSSLISIPRGGNRRNGEGHQHHTHACQHHQAHHGHGRGSVDPRAGGQPQRGTVQEETAGRMESGTPAQPQRVQ